MNFLIQTVAGIMVFFFSTTYSISTHGQSNEPSITVSGAVTKELKLTMNDLSKMKSLEVKVKDRDDKMHSFKGVTLVEILKEAGVTTGKELRGKNLTKYVLVEAADGYKVVFSLPELDPDFSDQKYMLTYEVDGKPLSNEDGPFRIIVPAEKKHARWIRQITGIKILEAKE